MQAGFSTVKVGDCTDHIYVGDTYIDAASQQEYLDAVLLSTHTTLLISLHGCARYSRTDAEGFIFNITKSGE